MRDMTNEIDETTPLLLSTEGNKNDNTSREDHKKNIKVIIEEEVHEGEGEEGVINSNKDCFRYTSNDSKNLVSSRRRIAIFGAIWTGVFLGAVDSTIVATLLSSISSSFGSSNQLSWLATSYLLAICSTGALYGKLSDLTGRRVAYLIALTFFTTGTLGCALSKSMEQLIFSRFIAGCGGGGIMTTSSIIATDLVRLDQRALIQGFANLCYGTGAALGGPLGGWLTDSFGWRAAFFAQVPILVVAMILVALFINYRIEGQVTSRSEFLKRIDILGSITFIFTIGCLLLSLSFKNNLQYEWLDPRVYGSAICFVFGLILFTYVENYKALEPVLPVRLLKSRTPLCGVLVNCFSSMVGYSVLFNLPLWFETVKLSSATEAGLHLIPNSISLSLGSLAAGAWIRKTGHYKNVITISCCLMSLGAGLLRFRLDSPVHEWIDVIPNGLGFTAITTAILIALIAVIPSKDMAVATGGSYLFRYLGQVTGVAISGSILQANLASELNSRITGPGSAEIIDRIRHESSIIRDLKDGSIQFSARESYKIGLKKVFEFDLILSVLSLILSFGIREVSRLSSSSSLLSSTSTSPSTTTSTSSSLNSSSSSSSPSSSSSGQSSNLLKIPSSIDKNLSTKKNEQVSTTELTQV